MTISKEEIFGPVLSIIAYRTEEEAIRIIEDYNATKAGSDDDIFVQGGYTIKAK